jgi:hypothetical protein
MNISRRAFLGGAIALAAATVVPVEAIKALAPLPQIVGDGVHDDTAGLQALIDGEPVLIGAEVVTAEHGAITLQGGVYLISSPLVINRTLWIDRLCLVAAEGFSGTCAIEIRENAINMYVGTLYLEGFGAKMMCDGPRPDWLEGGARDEIIYSGLMLNTHS